MGSSCRTEDESPGFNEFLKARTHQVCSHKAYKAAGKHFFKCCKQWGCLDNISSIFLLFRKKSKPKEIGPDIAQWRLWDWSDPVPSILSDSVPGCNPSAAQTPNRDHIYHHRPPQHPPSPLSLFGRCHPKVLGVVIFGEDSANPCSSSQLCALGQLLNLFKAQFCTW